MNFQDTDKQIANLKQVIRQSEAGIVALQALVRQTQAKLRKLEAEAITATGMLGSPRTPAPSSGDTKIITGLKMFH